MWQGIWYVTVDSILLNWGECMVKYYENEIIKHLKPAVEYLIKHPLPDPADQIITTSLLEGMYARTIRTGQKQLGTVLEHALRSYGEKPIPEGFAGIARLCFANGLCCDTAKVEPQPGDRFK